MRRVLVPMMLGALLVAATAVPALAAKPERAVVVAEPFELPAGDACEFAVLVDPITQNEKSLTFVHEDGTVTQKVSGRFILRLTNLDSDESIVFQSNGPGEFLFRPDGSFRQTLHGNTFNWLTAAEGGPEMWLHKGMLVYEVQPPDFLFRIVHETGHRVDLCAMLR